MAPGTSAGVSFIPKNPPEFPVLSPCSIVTAVSQCDSCCCLNEVYSRARRCALRSTLRDLWRRDADQRYLSWNNIVWFFRLLSRVMSDFESPLISFLSSLSCIHEYLAIESGGNETFVVCLCKWIVFANQIKLAARIFVASRSLCLERSTFRTLHSRLINC